MNEEFSEKDICERIRALRKNLKMSINELAEKINMSKAYISKIEKSHKAPPISTLFKISKVLKVDLTYLISGKIENEEISYVKADEITLIPSKGSEEYGYKGYSLAYKISSKLMEPFKLEVSNKAPTVFFSHTGQEFNYLLEGDAEIIVNNKVFKMQKGDSLYFNSLLPHYLRSTKKEKAIFISVDVSLESNSGNK